MKKKAVIFLDYNETFDDIREGKGRILSSSLTRFCKSFDWRVDIVVITSAHHSNPNFSIRDDFKHTLTFFPGELRSKFKYLIEHNCKYLTPIDASSLGIDFKQPIQLPYDKGTKKDGVEVFFDTIDPTGEYTTCVFAGNCENTDFVMMDADVGSRQKYFLLANRRVLKSEKYPVYRLSMQKQERTYNHGKDIMQAVGPQDSLVIKTGTKSYGVGRGLQALTSYLHEKELNK